MISFFTKWLAKQDCIKVMQIFLKSHPEFLPPVQSSIWADPYFLGFFYSLLSGQIDNCKIGELTPFEKISVIDSALSKVSGITQDQIATFFDIAISSNEQEVDRGKKNAEHFLSLIYPSTGAPNPSQDEAGKCMYSVFNLELKRLNFLDRSTPITLMPSPLCKEITMASEGEKRSKVLSDKYGISSQEILAFYESENELFFETFKSRMPMDKFEISIRNTLYKNNPKVRDIVPLYCFDNDPLNPEGWWDFEKQKAVKS